MHNGIASRYGRTIRILHWVSAMLVLATYALSKGDHYSLYSADAGGVRMSHEMLGLLVLIVAILMITSRRCGSSRVKLPMQRRMAGAARLVQFTLYALLIAIPVTAVLGTWLEGLPITLPGLDVAFPIVQSREVGQMIMRIHGMLGEVILWIAGAHAAAALFHHFYLRDEVLRSMGPGG